MSSTGTSGAAASASDICAWLKEGFEVDLRFMLVTISAGNQVRPGLAIGPNQHRYTAPKPAQALQALLAVEFAGVFFGQHRRIENASTLGQIDAVLGEVGSALGFVASDHARIVLTICDSVEHFVNTFYFVGRAAVLANSDSSGRLSRKPYQMAICRHRWLRMPGWCGFPGNDPA
jgi:hypothetical protein